MQEVVSISQGRSLHHTRPSLVQKELPPVQTFECDFEGSHEG